MSKIKLQVLRPMMLNGQRLETGFVFEADVGDVCSLTEAGRCALLNPGDAAVARSAGQQKGDGGYRERPPAGWPWVTRS